MENIRRLLEIAKAKRNHELLLTTRNLRELAACAFPYIIPVVPRSVLVELIEGEHFVLANLCKSSLGMEGAPNEAGAPLEKGFPAGGPSNVDEIGEGSLLRIATAPIPPHRLANTVFIRRRLPN